MFLAEGLKRIVKKRKGMEKLVRGHAFIQLACQKIQDKEPIRVRCCIGEYIGLTIADDKAKPTCQ